MAKHNPENAEAFRTAMVTINEMSEHELFVALRPVIAKIETDDTYNTDAKLKIYALLDSLTNCSGKDRKKWAAKVERALR